MQLSKNFTLAELCASSTAKAKNIDNTPNDEVVRCLAALCKNVLQPLRDGLGIPILISSGYRCPELNRAVGGASTSQHQYGQAADIKFNSKVTGLSIFNFIQNNLEFDQLIYEHNKAGTYWVHVSFRTGRNRKQVIKNLLKK